MYIMETMIDLGLNEGQKWPSEYHKDLAIAIGLCNPMVTKRDQLIEIVQAVMAIPESALEGITWGEIVNHYHVPYVRLS